MGKHRHLNTFTKTIQKNNRRTLIQSNCVNQNGHNTNTVRWICYLLSGMILHDSASRRFRAADDRLTARLLQ